MPFFDQLTKAVFDLVQLKENELSFLAQLRLWCIKFDSDFKTGHFIAIESSLDSILDEVTMRSALWQAAGPALKIVIVGSLAATMTLLTFGVAAPVAMGIVGLGAAGTKVAEMVVERNAVSIDAKAEFLGSVRARKNDIARQITKAVLNQLTNLKGRAMSHLRRGISAVESMCARNHKLSELHDQRAQCRQILSRHCLMITNRRDLLESEKQTMHAFMEEQEVARILSPTSRNTFEHSHDTFDHYLDMHNASIIPTATDRQLVLYLAEAIGVSANDVHDTRSRPSVVEEVGDKQSTELMFQSVVDEAHDKLAAEVAGIARAAGEAPAPLTPPVPAAPPVVPGDDDAKNDEGADPELREFLTSVGLGQLLPKFTEQMMDLKTLRGLGLVELTADLTEMHIPVGARRRITRALGGEDEWADSGSGGGGGGGRGRGGGGGGGGGSCEDEEH